MKKKISKIKKEWKKEIEEGIEEKEIKKEENLITEKKKEDIKKMNAQNVVKFILIAFAVKNLNLALYMEIFKYMK